jgi:hypothetical protein
MEEILSYRCSKCKETKSVNKFSKDARTPKGHRSHCKDCVRLMDVERNARPGVMDRKKIYSALWRSRHPGRIRETKLLDKYGIRVEQYEEMFRDQYGKCAICGSTQKNVFHVDHDHETGIVRGLLCMKCNLMIGYAKDNPENLIAAAQYLKNCGIIKKTQTGL